MVLELPTTIFNHLQGVPGKGLPGAAARITPNPWVQNVEHREDHGLTAVEKKNICVARIRCLRKGKGNMGHTCLHMHETDGRKDRIPLIP